MAVHLQVPAGGRLLGCGLGSPLPPSPQGSRPAPASEAALMLPPDSGSLVWDDGRCFPSFPGTLSIVRVRRAACSPSSGDRTRTPPSPPLGGVRLGGSGLDTGVCAHPQSGHGALRWCLPSPLPTPAPALSDHLRRPDPVEPPAPDLRTVGSRLCVQSPGASCQVLGRRAFFGQRTPRR